MTTEPSLRERLIALVNETPSLLVSGVRVPMVVSWPDAMNCRETLALAAARMALEAAAMECERRAKIADNPDSIDPSSQSAEWKEASWQCPGSMMFNANAIRALADSVK